MSLKPSTIHEALLQASSFLDENSVQESRFIAELLLRHLLEWDRATLFMQWHDPFPEAKRTEWQRMLQRKAAGEPVQYITGEQEFYGLPFGVSPAVLIPRPETEVLVEHIIAAGRQLWPEGPKGSPLLVDIGTGSGAIAITVAVRCPGWQVAASDISGSALEVAQMNAIYNKVDGRINWYQGDLLEPFILGEVAIDILVSNPPYIETEVIKTLQLEVRAYEPMSALDGGVDGLSFYRKIIKQLAGLPAYPQLVGFEVGQGQAPQVAEMLKQCGQWDQITIIPDLAGIERHIIGIRTQIY